MKIIQRQYLMDFLKSFAIIALGLTALMTVISSFSGAAKFSSAEAGMATIIQYSLLGIPKNFSYVASITALVAALLTVGKASGARELVAITAAGGRLKAMLAPLIAAGLILSLLIFAVTELVMPYCARKADNLLTEAIGGNNSSNMADGSTWMRTEDGAIARFGFSSRAGNSYGDISIFKSQDGRLKQITRARRASHIKESGKWNLKKLSIHDFAIGETARMKQRDYDGLPDPSELRGSFYYSSRMSVFELIRHLRKLKAAGFRNPEIDIEIHTRFASPLISLVMVLIGTAIAARRSVGAMLAATIGISVTALYWLLITLASAMGLAGMIPPYAAGWLVPLLLTAASAYLYSKIPE